MAVISIIAGSASDQQIVQKVTTVLDEEGIPYDYQVLSAHRDPDRLDEYIRTCDANVFIAIAGLSAALPGVIAARTRRPVIGVPVSGSLGGLDALLSIVQMPKGVPVACVGIDNGANAAYLAIRILHAAGV
ncbi:5-(carboxyamino)imidazole ribonucleotide mutase [Methanosphaerula palustris]|uniref:N5-carboxyaminoimidazole ribonucleotide mutase n=1 Tax=Methanosphaerula palustris (strain ATCC BAA-1556 / DSM 19958 / E1-9c) TaxID=521011 RepID=B8GKA8_METPE|nr:5-(carboxyamino)imidazole ribonucleotide mutase [Methanosphaerula palustris]ACL15791.1 Phosphoribosylaminoimidazole carboxylase [Methanosphaerula palustris E1-9c]